MNVVVLNAWPIFLKGGPMMWPLLFLSVVGLAIGINRLAFLGRLDRTLTLQKEALQDSLRRGRLKETVGLCEQQKGPLSRMVKAGILKFGQSRDIMSGAVEEVLFEEQQTVKQHMDLLSLILNVAPLLGLLGTVNGMAVVFHAAQIRSNVLNPLSAGELSSGIWQSLISTSAGLMVGILIYVMYGFLAMRINRAILYLQRAKLEIINMLQQLAELKNPVQEPDYGA